MLTTKSGPNLVVNTVKHTNTIPPTTHPDDVVYSRCNILLLVLRWMVFSSVLPYSSFSLSNPSASHGIHKRRNRMLRSYEVIGGGWIAVATEAKLGNGAVRVVSCIAESVQPVSQIKVVRLPQRCS